MEAFKFEKNDIENVINQMSSTELDNLTFGAVQVDKNGKILTYNKKEGDITGRNPLDMVGKNFFTEVAPCTNSQAFYGKFKEGVGKGDLNVVFNYVFDYNMTPTQVMVYMKKALAGESYWIFIKNKGA